MTKYKLIHTHVIKYASVPEHEVHTDYQKKGIAPVVGHYLNQIAQEDSDAGSLAQGILQTGEHSLLPILNDKLQEDGHPLAAHYGPDGKFVSGPLDWHHVSRAIAIDKHVSHLLRPKVIAGYAPGMQVETAPQSPTYVLSNKHNRVPFVIDARSYGKGISRDDVIHSLIRLGLNEKGRTEPLSADHAELVKATADAHNTSPNNPHQYVDTRKSQSNPFLYKAMKSKKWIGDKIKLLVKEGYSQKQAVAIALTMGKTKYSVTKAGAKGMVDQISPLAAFGVWRKPGQFSTSLEFTPSKEKPAAPVSPYQAASTKANSPVNPFDTIKTKKKLSVEYVRKLTGYLKKLKSKKK